jgi:hypothetical protein
MGDRGLNACACNAMQARHMCPQDWQLKTKQRMFISFWKNFNIENPGCMVSCRTVQKGFLPFSLLKKVCKKTSETSLLDRALGRGCSSTSPIDWTLVFFH